MSLAKTARSMTETAILRRVYGERHTAKRIALDRGVSLATAKAWLRGRIAGYRLAELLPAMERQLEMRLQELAAAEAELLRLRRARAALDRLARRR